MSGLLIREWDTTGLRFQLADQVQNAPRRNLTLFTALESIFFWGLSDRT